MDASKMCRVVLLTAHKFERNANECDNRTKRLHHPVDCFTPLPRTWQCQWIHLIECQYSFGHQYLILQGSTKISDFRGYCYSFSQIYLHQSYTTKHANWAAIRFPYSNKKMSCRRPRVTQIRDSTNQNNTQSFRLLFRVMCTPLYPNFSELTPAGKHWQHVYSQQAHEWSYFKEYVAFAKESILLYDDDKLRRRLISTYHTVLLSKLGVWTIFLGVDSSECCYMVETKACSFEGIGQYLHSKSHVALISPNIQA